MGACQGVSDPFFIVHFGAFCAGHGTFLAILFPVKGLDGREEYRHTDFGQLMMRPYGRIIVVHIFIIAGGFIVTGMNSPLFAMVLFVVIKTAVDLHMHQRERKLLSVSK